MGVGAAPRSGLGAGRGRGPARPSRGRGAAREGGGGGSGRRRWAGSSGAGWPGRARPDRRTAREDRGGGGRRRSAGAGGAGGPGRARPGRRTAGEAAAAAAGCVCRLSSVCVGVSVGEVWSAGQRVCLCVARCRVHRSEHTAKHSNFARSIESYEKKNKMTTPCLHGYWLGWPVTLLQACS
jgi:hypothetical protein